MREARIWYSRDPNQEILPGGFENEIVLSDEFFPEITAHSIPTDLEAAKALSSSPAAMDLFMWLSYRCFSLKDKNAYPSSAISAWPANWGAPTMHGRASSVSA